MLARLRSMWRAELEPDRSEAMLAMVDYAIQVAAGYIGYLQTVALSPSGLRILELGPGSDFGPALILASLGAKVTIADRFLHKQGAEHHRRFNEQLLCRWHGPNEAIRRAVKSGSYRGVLTLENRSAEQLRYRGRFDVVLSNAVLEHIADPKLCCERLFRATAPGGYHFHQIDLRDHRDFDRPLEHLLSETDDFEPESEWRGQYGTRLRLDDFVRLFEEAGFLVDSATTNSSANDAYLRGFVPRLRASASPYRNRSVDGLRSTGALIICRRRG